MYQLTIGYQQLSRLRMRQALRTLRAANQLLAGSGLCG